MSKNIIVIGTGGHAKVVSEVIEHHRDWTITGYIDEKKKQDTFLNRPVFSSLDLLKDQLPSIRFAFVGIGDNAARKRWHHELLSAGFEIPSLVHPFTCVSPRAELGSGSLLAAGAVLGCASRVAEGVIINTASVIDHDVEVESFSHISQGVLVCGGARVGSEVLAGPGSIIEKLASVPSGTILSAGTVICSPKHQ